MKVTDLPIEQLKEASWNCNRMDVAMFSRLKQSILSYGVVEGLVVRPLKDNTYEVIGGNWRLKVLEEMGVSHVPCVVVELDDSHARLLAQALNHLRGEDDLGLRAELVKRVLEGIPRSEVLSILPETAENLESLASLGQETIAAYLQNWQQAQAARLRHLQFQLTPAQLDVVQEALAQVMPVASQERGESPNVRGTALFLLCQAYLQWREQNEH